MTIGQYYYLPSGLPALLRGNNHQISAVMTHTTTGAVLIASVYVTWHCSIDTISSRNSNKSDPVRMQSYTKTKKGAIANEKQYTKDDMCMQSLPRCSMNERGIRKRHHTEGSGLITMIIAFFFLRLLVYVCAGMYLRVYAVQGTKCSITIGPLKAGRMGWELVSNPQSIITTPQSEFISSSLASDEYLQLTNGSDIGIHYRYYLSYTMNCKQAPHVHQVAMQSACMP